MQRRSAARRVTRAGGLLRGVPLDATAAAPLYDQLYAWLRERIVDGSLVAGTRLALAHRPTTALSSATAD